MAHTVTLMRYGIDRCGIYPWGSEHAMFGNPSAVMEQLRTWVHNKPLPHTATYGEGDLPVTYCRELRYSAETDSYLLALWNRATTEGGQIASVSERSTVGSAPIKFTRVGASDIPGYDTYFWILPNEHTVATVSVWPGTSSGRDAFDEYMTGFLAKASKYVVVGDDDDEAEILGYSEDGSETQLDEDAGALTARFRTISMEDPRRIRYLREHREEIVAILRKDRITARNGRSMLTGMLERIGLAGSAVEIAEGIPVNFRVRYTPDDEQLDTIIGEYARRRRGSQRFDNVGFEMADRRRVWLTSRRVRRDISLDMRVRRNEAPNARRLLKELEAHRDELVDS